MSELIGQTAGIVFFIIIIIMIIAFFIDISNILNKNI